MKPQIACRAALCDRVDLDQCQYVDLHGEPCATLWCPSHLQTVHGVAVCRRHAGVLRSLGHQPGTRLPELANRAPSLVNWIFRDIEFAVRALLATDGRTEDAVADSAVQAVADARGILVWEQSLASHGDPPHEVTVAVDESRPTLVTIRVDRHSVLEAEPPWITRRLGRSTSDADPATDDAGFFSAIRVQIAGRLGGQDRGGQGS